MPSAAPEAGDPPKLKRALTLTHATLYGLGVTIGAGIYVLIGGMAGRAGLYAPVAFFFAALIMALTAATYAELATRHPVSAGAAAYVGEAFRSRAMTLAVGILTSLVGIISAAAIAIGSTGYIGAFVDVPANIMIPLVVFAMGLIAAWGIRESVTFAGVLTLIEVGGLLVIIVAGIYSRPSIAAEFVSVIPAPSDGFAWAGVLGAGMLAFFAFIGFEDLANVAEEVREPEKTLPRAILLTLVISTLLYFLVAAVAVLTVAPTTLATSPAPLSIVFDRVTRLPPQTFGAIAIVATLNGVIVQMIMVSRILYGLSDRGHLPSQLSRVHPVTRTPLLATALVVVLVLVLAMGFRLEVLAEWTSRVTLVVFALVNTALLKIKMDRGVAPAHAFVVPAWIPALGALSCIAFLLADVLR